MSSNIVSLDESMRSVNRSDGERGVPSMGLVKLNLDKTPVDPALVRQIRHEIGASISELSGLSSEAALALFDQSPLAKAVAERPWPIMHESAEYWATHILEQAGLTTTSEA